MGGISLHSPNHEILRARPQSFRNPLHPARDPFPRHEHLHDGLPPHRDRARETASVPATPPGLGIPPKGGGACAEVDDEDGAVGAGGIIGEVVE